MSLRPPAADYESVFPARQTKLEEVEACLEFSLDKTKAVSENPERVQQDTNCISFGETSRNWLRGNGHTFSFAGLFVFTIVLYFRPYETIPFLSSFTSMAFYIGILTLTIYVVTQLALEGNLTARPKEINLVLLLGLAALFSMPLAIDPAEAWQTFIDLLVKMVVIFVVIVNVVRTELRLKLLLLLAFIVSIYLSANAIYDYQQGLFQVGTLETHDARIVGRIRGLFENSNDLALHLVCMVPIAFALGLAKGGLVRKALYFGAAALMIGAIIVTFSRGGFIGLVAVTLVLVRRLGRKKRVSTAGALIFGLILFIALAPAAYTGRLATILDSSADLTESSSQRTQVLKRSILVALRYPLFGVGIGNFHHKSIRELATHNAYTQVAAEMGIAAMIIYIMFLVHPLRRLRLVERESYAERRQSKFYYLSIGLQASLIGYMVSSFFGAVAYQWYAYYLVGYAVCLHRLFLMRPGVADPEALWRRPFSKKNQSPHSGTTDSQVARNFAGAG